MIQNHHAIYLCLIIAAFTLGLMVGLERWATGPTQAQRELQVSPSLSVIPDSSTRRLGAPWEQGYHPFAPPPWIERRLKHQGNP